MPRPGIRGISGGFPVADLGSRDAAGGIRSAGNGRDAPPPGIRAARLGLHAAHREIPAISLAKGASRPSPGYRGTVGDLCLAEGNDRAPEGSDVPREPDRWGTSGRVSPPRWSCRAYPPAARAAREGMRIAKRERRTARGAARNSTAAAQDGKAKAREARRTARRPPCSILPVREGPSSPGPVRYGLPARRRVGRAAPLKIYARFFLRFTSLTG